MFEKYIRTRISFVFDAFSVEIHGFCWWIWNVFGMFVALVKAWMFSGETIQRSVQSCKWRVKSLTARHAGGRFMLAKGQWVL